MKSLLFSEFYNGKYDDHGYELYLVKDSDDNIMYVGISRDSVGIDGLMEEQAIEKAT